MSDAYSERFPLSPELQDFVATHLGFAPGEPGLTARRAAFLRGCRHFTGPLPAGWQVIDSRLGDLALRCYKPAQTAPEGGWPVLLYLHGGGWDLGGLDTHDWFAHAVAERVQVAIVAVEYRLAPQCPFPAALEDCLAVWHALREGAVDGDLSRERRVVCGDSAGGSLAAGLCMALRDQGESQPDGQALVYPVLTTDTREPSATRYGDAPMLSNLGLANSFSSYLPEPAQRQHPWAMPLHASQFRGLAPAFIGVAELDILYEEGLEYAAVLQAADVPAQTHVGHGLLHGSLRARGVASVEVFYDALATAIEGFFWRASQQAS